MSFVGFVRSPDGRRAIVGDRFAGNQESFESYRMCQPKVFNLNGILAGSVGSFRAIEEMRRFDDEGSAVSFARRCQEAFRVMAGDGTRVSETTLVVVADAHEVRTVSYVDRVVHHEFEVPGADGWRVVALGPGRQLGYGAAYAALQAGEDDPERIVRTMAEAAAGWCSVVRPPFDVLALPAAASTAWRSSRPIAENVLQPAETVK
jgi:ATP-dependent protease HslVU (ClpYQ) peptidase subunit